MSDYAMFQLETVQVTHDKKAHNMIPEITTDKER